MIIDHGPVEAAFTVYEDFANYSSGIYHHVTGNIAGVMRLRLSIWGVGTEGAEKGVEYWKVANSWNPFWGESGFFRIKRGVDECGIEDNVMANSPDSKWGPKQ